MSVGLLLVTHQRVGTELLRTAANTLEICPLHTHCLEVRPQDDPDERIQTGSQLAAELDQGDGVLILTDACGSTPSNVAARIHTGGPVRIVAGLNLPMLLRVYNYAGLTLEALLEAALIGGRDGVTAVNQEASS